VVNLDTALGEEFLDVAVRQPEAQVPADREDDDVGWERKPAKADRVARAGRGRRVLMPGSLAAWTRSPPDATVPVKLILTT
jgi:hypothetical protein